MFQPSTHTIPALTLINHEFTCPLDYTNPDGEQITVFAREIVTTQKRKAELPWLVFLQGGPGFGAPRPSSNSGWLKRALPEYRVLLLDQRGTGLSSPVTYQTLAPLTTPEAQANYLQHFRADAIVQDAERIRRSLIGDEPWSVLGQSYGGFCIAHYLSAAPEGLREAIFTGGLPPMLQTADEVYRATYQRVIEKNQAFYARYPEDVGLAQEIVDYLGQHDVRLPSGDRLTPRRFQQLGLNFGMSDGFERVHYLLEEAFVEINHQRTLSYSFLRQFENAFAFETNPIFAILHEAIYCQKNGSNWAAERVRAEYPQFDAGTDQPITFTGEMIYPWMFDEYRFLRPLKGAAKILAAKGDWPQLYDLTVLGQNSVPCAAVVYYNDMYVERRFSEEAAQAIKGIQVWITNEYEHNGLRIDGVRLLNRLLGMIRGEI